MVIAKDYRYKIIQNFLKWRILQAVHYVQYAPANIYYNSITIPAL
jgi:hypothetical protein